MAITDREISPPEFTGPDGDRRLVEAHRGGNPDAFPELVRANYGGLLAHGMRRLGDLRAAEDAVQETLLRAYRGLATFNGDYRLQPWLHRILTNVCHDEGDRRRREAAMQTRLSSAQDGDSFRDHAADVEARLEIRRCIALLPDAYREALVLRDLYELEYTDVADRTGISEENARARVHRARAALRRLVEPSAALGAFVLRGWRRASRWVPRVAEHVANSSAAAPDVVTLPQRTGLAVTAVATTSVAVVAVAAPIIGAHIDPPAPARPPASAATHPVVVSTPASLAQAPVATVTTVPVTTTTAGPVTSTTLVNSAATAVGSSGTGGTAPAGAAGPVAKLASDGVVLDAGGGLTEEPGTLTIGSEAPIAGSLRTVVVLPAAGSQACTGSLLVRFLWTDAHLKTFEIDVKATFRSASVHGGSTDYALSGPATAAAGTPGVGKGPLEGSGTLAVPASGSAGALALSVSSSTGSPAPTCPAPDPTPSTSTTSTSTTSTTTVTHDTPTTAVGAAQAGS